MPNVSTPEQETEFRKVIRPIIKPLILILSEAILAGELARQAKSTINQEDFIEEQLLKIIKYTAAAGF